MDNATTGQGNIINVLHVVRWIMASFFSSSSSSPLSALTFRVALISVSSSSLPLAGHRGNSASNMAILVVWR